MLALLGVLVAASPALPAVTDFTLPNGMRWLIVERHAVPRFWASLRVRAGGLDEAPGTTGAAHLLEHLAFRGTPVTGSHRGWSVEQPFHDEALAAAGRYAALQRAGQASTPAGRQALLELRRLTAAWDEKADSSAFVELFVQRGIAANAATTKDDTEYFADVPAGQLEFWLTAEAQRFAAPVFRDFEIARRTVLAELNQRRRPIDRAFDSLLAQAFSSTGYGWPTIGRAEDVQALSPAEVGAFYAAHYGPGNAVGCLVGDVDPAVARRLVERTFGVLPARRVAPRLAPPALPAAPTRAAVTAGDQRMVLVAARAPPWPARDAAVLPVVGELLEAAGPDGRFAPRLLDGADPLATSVEVFGLPGAVAEHLLVIAVALAGPHTPTEVEAAIWAALRDFGDAPPSGVELAGARAALELATLRSRRSSEGLAGALSAAALHRGRWQEAFAMPFLDVSAEEVAAAAAALRPERAFVVTVELQP